MVARGYGLVAACTPAREHRGGVWRRVPARRHSPISSPRACLGQAVASWRYADSSRTSPRACLEQAVSSTPARQARLTAMTMAASRCSQRWLTGSRHWPRRRRAAPQPSVEAETPLRYPPNVGIKSAPVFLTPSVQAEARPSGAAHHPARLLGRSTPGTASTTWLTRVASPNFSSSVSFITHVCGVAERSTPWTHTDTSLVLFRIG